jgi:hypothetical protein
MGIMGDVGGLLARVVRPNNSTGSEVLKDVSVTLQFFTTGDSPEVPLVESLEAADVGQRFAMPTGGLT